MRNFIVHEEPQHLPDGTANPAWLQARIARVTGTSADAMLAGGQGVQRGNLKIRLAVERLTGRSLEKDFQSAAMLQGITREAAALAMYEAKTGLLIETCGFISHPELYAGCSIDGFYNDFEGLVSIKCPELSAHVDTVRRGTITLKYLRQIRHEQALTGALWTDFVSFNPDFPDRLQLVVIRVPRKDDEITRHFTDLRAFLDEVQVEFDSLRTLAEGMAVAGAA